MVSIGGHKSTPRQKTALRVRFQALGSRVFMLSDLEVHTEQTTPMASLELSRVVNDAVQNGDANAALAPLRTQPQLRVSDLPKLEKKSLTALTSALLTPSNAQLWARALLDSVPSVHLFALRSLRRLGQGALPVATPLRDALEQFWEQQSPPDAEVINEETAQQRKVPVSS